MNDFESSGSGQYEKNEAEAPVVGFCQNCGKGLSAETIRVVGPAVFCEACLAARLAGAAPPPSEQGYRPVDFGTGHYGSSASTGAPGYGVPPFAPDGFPAGPNPGLATWLGFIPGVGAMYNEQYAKGVVHLIVFVILVALSADVNGLFGIFIGGWEFYMAIEAHHTAKALREGLPLPNPFGLNDIGERLGFGKAWPGHPSVASAAGDAARAAAHAASGATQDAAAYAAQAAAERARKAPYNAGPGFAETENPVPPGAAWTQPGGSGQPAAAPPEWATNYGVPPTMPTGLPFVPVDPAVTGTVGRFPVGAVWLIGLGCVFLLATTGLFEGFRTNALIGLGLMGLGIWVFLRRLGESGLGLQSDGTPAYRFRVIRACRGAIWLFLIGLWFLLESLHLVLLHHTWPLILIVAGVLLLVERLSYNAAAAGAATAGAWPEASTPTAGAPHAGTESQALVPTQNPLPRKGGN